MSSSVYDATGEKQFRIKHKTAITSMPCRTSILSDVYCSFVSYITTLLFLTEGFGYIYDGLTLDKGYTDKLDEFLTLDFLL